MSKRLIVYPYKMGSGSASRLCEEIRARGYRALKVYPDRKYAPKLNDLVLNWGSSICPEWAEFQRHTFDLNPPRNVEVASDKLKTLHSLVEHAVPTVVYTTDIQEAIKWYSEGLCVVGRAKLKGHSGDGIHITDPLSYPQSEGGVDVQMMSEMVYGIGNGTRPLPLYTQYFKRKAEYRVHVFNGQVIDWQQKMKRRDYDGEVDTKVRCHHNGWIYARDAAKEPDSRVLDASIAAVQALGLDFGAVDVAWNEHYKQAAVFEVNTAPGLYGITLNKYVDELIKLLEE